MMGERDDCAQTGYDDPHLNYIRSSRITFRTGGRGEEGKRRGGERTEGRKKKSDEKASRVVGGGVHSRSAEEREGDLYVPHEIISSSSLGE